MSCLFTAGGRFSVAMDSTVTMDSKNHVTSIPPINSLNEFIFKPFVGDLDLLLLIVVGESLLNFLEYVQ